MALVARCARDRIRARTHACLARVGLRTRVAVGARRPVCRWWAAASSIRRITRARDVALITRCARDRIRARTHASLTRVGLRTRIAVRTRRAIRRWWVGTSSIRRITGARDVALIARCARDRVRARTHASLARVGLGTRIAVRTRRPVRDARVYAPGRRNARVGRADVAVIAADRRSDAGARAVAEVGRAGAAVVAGGAGRFECAR